MRQTGRFQGRAGGRQRELRSCWRLWAISSKAGAIWLALSYVEVLKPVYHLGATLGAKGPCWVARSALQQRLVPLDYLDRVDLDAGLRLRAIDVAACPY